MMANQIVYVPKPELTIFHDTMLECELMEMKRFNQCKLRVKSVLTGNGNQLDDLTARNQDSIIWVNKNRIYYSIEELKLAS